MTSTLKRLQNGNIKVKISFPWQEVKNFYQKALKKLQATTTIKGFRRGKAPLKVVEEKLGKETIYEEVLKALISSAYIQAIKKYNLKPIVSPQFKIISLKEGDEWQLEFLTCEEPQVTLNDYKEKIRKELAVEKIWLPGKKEKKQTSQEEKLEKIFKILTEVCQVKVPDLLIEEEVNRQLSKLLDQLNTLGLTIDQYLTSQGKTKDQLKEEYRQKTEETLKLEFILDAIANQEKLSATEEEIENLLNALPNQQEKEKIIKNPLQKEYLSSLIKKRKVIDNLLAI
ncbi:MAG: trigger factor [Microgenomates group bacterium]